MSQPGYGYAPPDGYNIHQGFAHTTQSTYSPISNTLMSTSHGQPSAPVGRTSPSYGHGQIPGLGLGTPSTSSTGQGSWSNGQLASWQPELQAHQNVQQMALVLPKSNPSPSIPGLNGSQGVVLEDGEVSEDGELEDVYEPMETEQDTAGVDFHELAQHRYQSNDVRERSGSYSPYLSPREISPPEDTLYNHQTGKSDGLNKMSSPVPADFQELLPSIPSHSRHTSQTELEATKKQAKDAILRLWPLNIRFQNYVTAGIDETVLKSLFKDLGLNFTDTAQLHLDSSVTKSSNLTKKASLEKVAVDTASTAKPSPAKPKPAAVDPSESRKDRIARLLAAKGSKQIPAATSVPVAPVAPEIAQPEAKSTKSVLTQSEKSKLLQQKMEALKKEREALRQQRPTHLDDKNDSSKSESTPEAPKPPKGNEPIGLDHDASADAIPGLSLSPDKQLTELSQVIQQPSTALKAADLRQVRLVPAFDQNMESRPFLIDVSDDEDGEDAEMEIDSPGQPETPPNVPNTPGQRDDLLRDLSTLSESVMARQARSPASISTPLRSASRNNGSDLESMNKQIEEMKRKIAEAEARKKAKNSRQGSPALSQQNDSSIEDSSDVASRPAAPATPSYGELGHAVKAVMVAGSDRRSRSRAASERLPLIEARRRDQLLKLRTLQSEVARIEQELEEAMLEEERLKGEILGSDSDKEVEQSIPAGLSSSGERQVIHDFVRESTPYSSIGVGDPSEPETNGLDQPMAEFGVDYHKSTANEDFPPVHSQVNPDLGARDIGSSVDYGSVTGTAIVPEANAVSHEGESSNSEAASHKSQVATIHSDGPEDVAMDDAGYSADEDAEGDSEDGYEPPDATLSAADENYDPTEQGTDVPVQSDDIMEAISDASSDKAKEDLTHETDNPGAPKSGFVPYETPLHYFHAYRFHPSFNQDVTGGLRSLTYSNKIDVKKELCPDELAGRQCPRGIHCDYQHFETMQAPDDQILLQLGAAEHYDEGQKQKYIAGLKQLLTDYRTHKVKDFNTISQGIVEFRAKFLGDKTKILPLGSVTL